MNNYVSEEVKKELLKQKEKRADLELEGCVID